MIFFVLILLLLIFNRAEFASPNKFHADYISKDRTNAIKGIFVALILLSHGRQYMELSGAYDNPYLTLQNHLGQMVVAMFLFYSGFGIMESIKRNGYGYVKSIPLKRFPSVLLNFNIALVLYLALGLYSGKTYDIKTILLSMVGWKSVGNSNWYMFAIFVLYILTFISFFFIKWVKNKRLYLIGIIILTALTVCFVYWEISTGQPHYSYDTVILFVLGCYYSYFKNVIEKILMKNDMIYFFILFLIIAVYVVSFRYRWSGGIEVYTVWAAAFTMLTVVLTMKISIQNSALSWLGSHVFSIYILQRIPMTLLSGLGLAQSHKYTFLIVSVAATIVMAAVFDHYTAKLTKAIWKTKGEAK